MDKILIGNVKGPSAYEIAKTNGFEGTEEEWLESLKGGSAENPVFTGSFSQNRLADTIVGDYSHAEGENTIAEGVGSHAEGKMTTAKGDYSHAEGEYTEANGAHSHAEGTATYANGDGAHTEGSDTEAGGENSHAEGASTRAKGDYSHSEGYRTIAMGIASHAEGNSTSLPSTVTSESEVDDIITAWNSAKFSLAFSQSSHVEGMDCLALGAYSHAEGRRTIAKAIDSHAEGYSTEANGQFSHAEGNGTKASGAASHAEGSSTSATKNYSHAEGQNTTAGGVASHAEGSAAKANGAASHAEGQNTTASGLHSHAEGNSTKASGGASHAEGTSTIASGGGSHAEGDETTASGEASHAEGCNTTASGDYSHAEGVSTEAEGYCSHAAGESTMAGKYQTVIGFNNSDATPPDTPGVGTGSIFIIGNGSSETFSNAFRVTANGQVYAAQSSMNTGADYAEYFEWADGNPDNEDRVGYFVTFDSKRTIKMATADDYILGIVSGNPAVCGNADECWRGRYVFDEFNRYIEEEVEGKIRVWDEEKQELITKTGMVTKWKENPDYDKTQVYIPRAQRPEWSAVGMMGVLPVRDDGTCQEGGYCTVAEGGIATACERTGNINTYRVIERVSDNIVVVVFR